MLGIKKGAPGGRSRTNENVQEAAGGTERPGCIRERVKEEKDE